MVGEAFSLSGLAPIFRDALQHREHTIAFKVAVGKGRFVFLIFFSEEDKAISDTLFLLLRNTNILLERKMYGRHISGGTRIFLEPEHERVIRAELQLSGGGPAFEFAAFFAQLNALIPQKLSLGVTVRTLRENWDSVKASVSCAIESALKTELIGIQRLKLPRRPKEVTLRKLYLHTEGSPSDIERCIAKLKRANITLAWRIPDPSMPARSFFDIFSEI